jgi:hypothetical protein
VPPDFRVGFEAPERRHLRRALWHSILRDVAAIDKAGSFTRIARGLDRQGNHGNRRPRMIGGRRPTLLFTQPTLIGARIPLAVNCLALKRMSPLAWVSRTWERASPAAH